MRVVRSLLLVAAALGTVGVREVAAHHGKDFLIVESYEVPHPGDVYFVSSAAIAREGSGTTVELEPSLLVGLCPRVALELHSHLSREPHDAISYEATAPSLHLQLTPPKSNFPIRVGFSAEYEFAAHPSAGDRAEARLIFETALGRSRLALNLVGEHERAGESTLGYTGGYRYEFTEALACGVEAQGPFNRGDGHELIAAVYAEPSQRVTLKFGAGAELGRSSAAPVARFGVVLRF
jgi:hypothetical protein